MPPEISDWLMIPRLSQTIVTAAWPYFVLPIDFIFGMVLVRHVFQAIRDLSRIPGGDEE